MSFQVHQGQISAPAGTGNQGFTGVGFQPKCVIFWANALTTTGFIAGAGLMIGAVSSTTKRFALLWEAADNLSPTVTQRDQEAALCLATPDPGGLTNNTATADLVSFDSDGFTLNFTKTTSGLDIHYLALGGADLTNVLCDKFSLNTVTGNQAVSGVGFQPDCVLFVGGNNTADGFANVAHMSIGAAKSSTKRWCVGLNAADAQSMTANVDALHTQRSDSCLIGLSDTGTLNHRADFVSMDANGFTINLATAPASAWNVFYIALKGGQYDVGVSAKPTGAATANQDVTVGFTPVGLFLQSWGLAASTSILADCEMSVGGSDGTNDGSIWAEEQDAVLNTEANSNNSDTKALVLCTGPSTKNSECDADFASVSNGFRLAWTTNDAVAKEICYVAFGSSPVAATQPYTPWPQLAPIMAQ